MQEACFGVGDGRHTPDATSVFSAQRSNRSQRKRRRMRASSELAQGEITVAVCRSKRTRPALLRKAGTGGATRKKQPPRRGWSGWTRPQATTARLLAMSTRHRHSAKRRRSRRDKGNLRHARWAIQAFGRLKNRPGPRRNKQPSGTAQQPHEPLRPNTCRDKSVQLRSAGKW